ncbi:MAG: right-handed parallel beta-helix repeat-containing protein [Thermoguttaceae bacterium]|nr:right-handed parallel beta-helix repeat-containing protein [Thermoguttaceae bacterium]MDW8079102.1 right-handed parallel beta-helix repeat-containing protein [Thermoguttaceae bacterium]
MTRILLSRVSAAWATFPLIIAFVSIPNRANPAELPRSLELLRQARQAWLGGRLEEARQTLIQIAEDAAVPAHHREEAGQLLELLAARGRDGAWEFPGSERIEVPPIKPGLRLFVASGGRLEAAGTAEDPFPTLEAAFQAVAKLVATGLPKGGIEIVVRGGTYPVRAQLRLGPEHSGTAESPVVVRAADGEVAIFSGGLRLVNFQKVTDPGVLERLPEEARPHVVQVDLGALGLKDLPPLVLGGFASGRGFRTMPVNELFWNKQPLTLARWPNEGFVRIEKVSSENPINTWAGPGSASGPIYFSNERLKRWAKEPEVLLYGYWYWGWADSYEPVDRIDPESGAIFLKPPHPRYGFGAGRPFFALNLLCELDRPGEYYIDRNKRILYFWPPGDPQAAAVELSVFSQPFMLLEHVSHVRFEGITWELGAGDAIHVRGGEGCVFAGCTVRCFAGDGIVFARGNSQPGAGVASQALFDNPGRYSSPGPVGCGVLSSDIHTMGRGGVVLAGGDRRTLTPAGNFVENCHLYDLSRIHHTYTPAVLIDGVGLRVRHNLVHDIGSSAFRVGGNENMIEFNEVFRVVLESDDQGAVDMHGNPTFRGNVFRYNYWHHIGGWDGSGGEHVLYRGGIRLDDAICGNLIYGNIFYRASAGRQGFGGVQIHGGKENIIDNNLFIDCKAAISFTPWGENRWREYIRGWLDRPDIDREVFFKRYPELARLEANADVNWVYRNVAASCGTLFLRNSRANLAAHNWTGPSEAVVEATAPGHFRLRQEAPIWREIGFRPIPITEIGLYRDRFRQNLAEEIRDAGRAGKDTSIKLLVDK